jgi:RimJ/RimL family protein N-acetyltransferase
MNIKLVPFKKEHGKVIAQWITDPDYADYFRGIEVIPTQEDCDNYPKWTGQTVMMIELEGIPIGELSLYNLSYKNRTGFIGVMIVKEYQKNQWARKAVVEWIRYLQNHMGLRKIIVETVDENLKRPLLEYGFVEEGIHKEQVLKHGIYVDEYRLAITGGAKCV